MQLPSGAYAGESVSASQPERHRASDSRCSRGQRGRRWRKRLPASCALSRSGKLVILDGKRRREAADEFQRLPATSGLHHPPQGAPHKVEVHTRGQSPSTALRKSAMPADSPGITTVNCLPLVREPAVLRVHSCLLMQGADIEELIRVKRVVQFAVYTAYRLRLETAFLADECASAAAVAIAADERAAALEAAINSPDRQHSGELLIGAGRARSAVSAVASSPERGTSPRRERPDGGQLPRPPPAVEAAQLLNRSESAASMMDSVSMFRLAAPRALSSAASMGSSQAAAAVGDAEHRAGGGMSRVQSACSLHGTTAKHGRAGTAGQCCTLAYTLRCRNLGATILRPCPAGDEFWGIEMRPVCLAQAMTRRAFSKQRSLRLQHQRQLLRRRGRMASSCRALHMFVCGGAACQPRTALPTGRQALLARYSPTGPTRSLFGRLSAARCGSRCSSSGK